MAETKDERSQVSTSEPGTVDANPAGVSRKAVEALAAHAGITPEEAQEVLAELGQFLTEEDLRSIANGDPYRAFSIAAQVTLDM